MLSIVCRSFVKGCHRGLVSTNFTHLTTRRLSLKEIISDWTHPWERFPMKPFISKSGFTNKASNQVTSRPFTTLNWQTSFYSSISQAQQNNETVRHKVEKFAKIDGRRPRVLMASGDHEHSPEIKAVAVGLADLGFDVELSPVGLRPANVAYLAVDSDSHAVVISTNEPGGIQMVLETIGELRQTGNDAVVVCVGAISNRQDAEKLRQAGIAYIFPFGVLAIDIAKVLLDFIPNNRDL